jgi:alkylation response protein AidB-like acyl-CoA dehydrogenase
MTVSVSREHPVEFDQVATRDWLQVARSFASSIEAARERIEHQRRVPTELIRAMADAGLFRLATPRVYGGEEISFVTLARTIEELSRADGSVGWTVLIGNNQAYHAGYLPDASATEIYGADASVIVAGSGFARHAVAKPVPGGYELTARWSLASGCPEASWFAAVAPILCDVDSTPSSGATGAPNVHQFFVPRADCTILETWDAIGLRGTSSHDVEVRSVFVPEGWHYPLRGPARLAGPLWRDTFLGVAAHALAAVFLGIARAAIDELTALAAAKTPHFSSTPLRDRPTIQAKLAQAEALVRSARSFFYETLEDIWRAACEGDSPSSQQAVLSQLSRTHAAHACAEAVDLMYAAAGSTALYATNRIARCFCDIHAVTQRGVVSSLGWEQAGRAFLGMEMGRR